MLDLLIQHGGGFTWSLGLLLLRLYVGGVLLAVHGIPKLLDMARGGEHFVPEVEQVGFPMPRFFAWQAAVAQVGGALLVIGGLATRPAAVVLASTVLIGVVGLHWRKGFHGMDHGLAYGAMLLTLAVAGGGALSIDALLGG